MTAKNPMVSAQTYINKGWALQRLGDLDSVPFYAETARQLCQSLPYNSGMVDVNLLNGTFLAGKGGDTLEAGVNEFLQVAQQATALNRAKAYHQLVQTYLKNGDNGKAEVMLDSLYVLLKQSDSPAYIRVDYQPILDHYLKNRNQAKVEQFLRMMLDEQQALEAKNVNFNLVESIVELQIAHNKQEEKIIQLGNTNQRLWVLVGIVLFVVVIAAVVIYLLYQRKQHKLQMKQADAELTSVVQKLEQSNAEKEMRAQEIKDFLKEKNNSLELEALTPSILLTEGESKFRQCFELLYPLFLPCLRERVPSITRREELLSMLIVLKQDNKRIAELLAVAPRSVLMLRHRFRQKIGMETEFSLENFIEEILRITKSSGEMPEAD